MCNLGERSQMIYYNCKRNIKTIKTRIGESLYSKVTTYKDGKRELEIYKNDKLIIFLEV